MMFVIYDQLRQEILTYKFKNEPDAREYADNMNWNNELCRRMKSRTGIPQNTYTQYVVRRAEA
jgi:hypothetical protein